MRLGLLPDSLTDRAALALGRVPTPFLQTHPALLLARTLMAATERGLFEALAEGPRTADAVAATCGTHPAATASVLDALVGSAYLRRDGAGYALSASARRWLLADSPASLVDSLRFRALEWRWIARLDAFLDTGEPVDFHAAMDADDWALYQRGMHALARLAVPETVRRTPIPRHARTLLDVGGAHGAFSVGFCARHPGLDAVVLDLPEAVEHAAPLLAEAAARAGVAGRVRHRPGDALADDLGEAVCEALAELLGTGGSVYAVDARPDVLAVKARPGGARVVPLAADFTEPLPLEDLDGVLMANALHFVEAVAVALEVSSDPLGGDVGFVARGVRHGLQ